MTRSLRLLAVFLVCLTVSGALAFGKPAPPTVDTPLYDCATRVFVRGFDPGATLKVYLSGSLEGTRTGATSYGRWVTLNRPLQGGEKVEVTQEVGGLESDRFVVPHVVEPDPAPLIRFELPVVACARGGRVHNVLPGEIDVAAENGDVLAHYADNYGGFATEFSRPLVSGEWIKARVQHCRIGQAESARFPVAGLYGEGAADLPTPTIKADTAIECRESVLVENMIPGAVANVYDVQPGGTPQLLGEGIATGKSAWVTLNAPTDPSWRLQARQRLCNVPSGWSPMVRPIPLSALDPPTVEAPIWAGQSHIYIRVPVSAPTTITVDGGTVRKDVEVYGRMRVNVTDPFRAGERVSAFYTVCGTDSPPAPDVVVLEPPRQLPPPQVGFPLFACGRIAPISGLIDKAEVRIYIDNTEVYRGAANGATGSFAIGHMLRSGEEVTATQHIGSIASQPSTAVVVFDAPSLDPPTIEEPLAECQRAVVVHDVVPGAIVTLYVNGTPFASDEAGGSTITIETFPLHQGWEVQVRQQLNACQESAMSSRVPVNPFNEESLAIPPTIVEPVYACQTSILVTNLTPGIELDVYLDGFWKKRVPVSATEQAIGIQPQLRENQRIQVFPIGCGRAATGQPSSVVSVRPPVLPPPVLHNPIFNGDKYVVVSDVPRDALILIRNDSGDQIGAGMGSPPLTKAFLWQAPSTGEELTAEASLCGSPSGPSNTVEVRADREPLPHDATVSYFWLSPSSKGQAVLHISGRNIYQGSTIRMDGQVYPTFPGTQFIPDLGKDADTLGTPIDTIGSVIALVHTSRHGVRFVGGQLIEISVLNPGGDSEDLRHHDRQAMGGYIAFYRVPLSMAQLDSDGDGLTDVEEQPGATPDLSALGANPHRQDVFVEADWMVQRDAKSNVTCTHEPNAKSFEMVVEAFRGAYVINPDGSRGIHMYVDYGQSGGRGGDELAHHSTIAFNASDGADVLYSHFYNNDFDANRRGLFHYCVFGHDQPGVNAGASGIAYYRSDQFMVTMINTKGVSNKKWINDVAGTFMHELGHNLNLTHGGDTLTNWKPNYQSIMSYTYQFIGIPMDCQTESDGVYDFSYGPLADLDERSLDENDGICDSVGLDWSNDGDTTDTGLRFNINSDTPHSYNSTSGVNQPLFNEYVDAATTESNQSLHDFCDWCYLTLDEVK